MTIHQSRVDDNVIQARQFMFVHVFSHALRAGTLAITTNFGGATSMAGAAERCSGVVVVAAVVGRGFAFVVVIVGVVPLFVVIGLRHSVATTFIARSFEVVGLGGDFFNFVVVLMGVLAMSDKDGTRARISSTLVGKVLARTLPAVS